MKPKFSIVIPIYNSEKYLSECLDSILGQTFQDIEIICVDDGSTDGSADILRRYEKMDGRIHFLSMLHGGPGTARNHGLAQARGEYLYFMDSDDFLSENDALAKLVSEIDAQGLEMLFVGTILDFENDNLRVSRYREIQRYSQGEQYGSFDRGIDLFRAMIAGGGFICNTYLQCARRDFLERIHASFPALECYEDEVYTFRTLLQAGKVRHVAWQPYVRRVRENSITTRKPAFRAVREGILAWQLMMEFLSEHDLEENTREAALLHLSRRGQDLIRKYRELPEEEQQKRREIPEAERSVLGILLNLQPVFRRQMASYLFPYHLFRRGEKILIYGAGNVGREFYLQAVSSGYVECTGILDRQANKRRADGLPVHLPEDILFMEYDAVLIAVQDKSLAESIRKDVQALGVPSDMVVWDGPHYLQRDFYEGYYFPLLDRLENERKDGLGRL